MKALSYVLSLAGALGALFVCVQAAQPLQFERRLQIIQTEEARFPKLDTPTILHGEARIAIEVDEKGVLRDALVVGYTRRPFADAALEAVRLWKYEPALFKGKPSSVVTELVFDFEATGVVVSLSASDTLSSAYFWWEKDLYAYHPVRIRQIDTPPTPLNAVQPPYSEELAAKGVHGEVDITFYIDETGAVRMPAIQRADNLDLAERAMYALTQWRFTPPTSRGQAVLVKAKQTFSFRPQLAQAGGLSRDAAPLLR